MYSTFRTQGLKFKALRFRVRVQALGFRYPSVQGSGFRVHGLGLKISDLGLKVKGLGSKIMVMGLASGVKGLGLGFMV
jgi:hypothetical protein